MGGVGVEPQEQDGEADLLGARFPRAERGHNSKGDLALTGRVLRADQSPDQRRAEAGGVCPEPPEVISPPFQPLQVGTWGLHIKRQSAGP